MESYGSFDLSILEPNHGSVTFDAPEAEKLLNHSQIQIEQWRNRSLSGLNFVHPVRRVSDGSDASPQSLPTLLYLRANQLRCVIIRSYLLNCTSVASKQQVTRAAVGLSCDTIDVLTDLNAKSSIYRKQHPIFQHFLASATSLLLLVLGNEFKWRRTSSAFLTDPVPQFDWKQSITRAFGLSSAYSSSSSASRRLWNRLVMMPEPLDKLGIMCFPQSTHEGGCIPSQQRDFVERNSLVVAGNGKSPRQSLRQACRNSAASQSYSDMRSVAEVFDSVDNTTFAFNSIDLGMPDSQPPDDDIFGPFDNTTFAFNSIDLGMPDSQPPDDDIFGPFDNTIYAFNSLI